MTTTTYSLTWDLDVFFKDGSNSEEFRNFLEKIKEEIISFNNEVDNWDSIQVLHEEAEFLELLKKLQTNSQMLTQAGAFVSCLQAQNTLDEKASELKGNVAELRAQLNTILTNFDDKLRRIEENQWKQLLQNPEIKELAFVLNERRELAKEKLPKEQEALVNSLSVDGYHGWGDMYDTLVSQVKIPFEENGEIVELSVGQAHNKFSNPDRNVRATVFKNWEKAWDEKADMFATTLNHLAGFRLSLYKERGWDEVLKEPLSYNRMQKETLESMWQVISDYKKPLTDYLKRKAELLGIEKLSWYDLDAPIGKVNTQFSYQEGAEFIIQHFGKFGDQLASFTKKAFEDSWIEAEDRAGKRPGGFCTSFPVSGQSRIFMTYSGTPSNVSTLAHELGHAFHSYALKNVHPLKRGYAMNVAETASTFAEMIVADASVKNAKNDEERLPLLEDKVQRSVALLMNIHSRFLFETRFYEERKKGIVSKKRLNELMLEAQKEAYGDGLEEYHPLFWASKLHFFITGVPFYNFPYTFGYLFSLGIYAQAQKEGKGYEEKYMALLQDTGSMKVEDLAMKHLNVDLTKRDFWEEGVKLCVKDVEEFLEATKQ
ncbi:M3 family oligoendopeptidase [Heyndrickxia oleronia]|uniref:M3 family oligoendopeptidase n=1 Tax=Heyndrickxia oleronia TaxID=38875 RepID=UPI00203DB190|nr:M3 family oligoendopeptidase [Heyndrickxia oleronia]MCI1591819.1 M3 family oligoendopeptidase [Heyndrickxia oleronia]MCI1614707.1 M3 family oligoendopeptidase [Heyndrickxia oleronia]MCI1745582.1 M3 family oligoendopeptidase [Heyndrickxia oleronia]MCI1762593.1 M3 family oligoendopeptidase [Heyndrickxia oleronia]MCM3455542.1 M3 family oligoendopeptidase [Heyndrickxia oleronia]